MPEGFPEHTNDIILAELRSYYAGQLSLVGAYQPRDVRDSMVQGTVGFTEQLFGEGYVVPKRGVNPMKFLGAISAIAFIQANGDILHSRALNGGKDA